MNRTKRNLSIYLRLTMQRNASRTKPGNLKPFFPFAEMPPEYVIVASRFAATCSADDQEIILESNSEDTNDYFLLKGVLLVEDIYGATSRLAAGTERATQPLPQLRPSAYRISAEGPATLIRIPQEVTRRVRSEAPEKDMALEDDATLDITQSREFFNDFKEELRMNRVRLPSLAPSAASIHGLLSGSKISADQLVSGIAMDPAICAKLLKMANSSLFNARGKVETLASLVDRLGVYSTREIAACFAFRDVFKNSSAELVERLHAQVSQAQQVSAMAAAVAEIGDVADPEAAALAGLMHNVGVLPIFSYSMHNVAYAMNPNLVDRAVAKMSQETGVLLARKWRFGERIIGSIENSHDWSYEPDGPVDLASIVITAKYHFVLGRTGIRSLPKPHEVPSIAAATGGKFDEKLSLRILARAREWLSRAGRQ